VIHAASTAQGISPDEAAGVILRQVIDRSFWVSTDHEMTRVTAEARADYLRRQAPPQLPGFMRDALERALADRK
jgi:hypothetical protein